MKNMQNPLIHSSVHPNICQQARTWLGTPFKHQGRVKGVGVDCLGLLIGVAQELDLRDAQGRKLAAFDALDYGHVPDEKRLWRGLAQSLHFYSPLAGESKSAKRDWVGGENNARQSPPTKTSNDVLTPPQGGSGHVNIALFRIDGTARHLGIIVQDSDYPTLIHAYAPARKVVEHRLDEEWERKIVACFEISRIGPQGGPADGSA